MGQHRVLKFITAIPLGISAIFFLVFVPSAHVTMCMACAIGYSLGLPVEKYENKINRIISFLAGGILFYTIYAGTTLLLLGWLIAGKPEANQPVFADPAFIYHFIINFGILTLFITKKDRIEYVLYGIEAFMIGAPVMLLIQSILSRELWGDETTIAVYVIIGVLIFIIHRLAVMFLNQEQLVKLMLGVRKLIIISLIVYTIWLIMIAFADPYLKVEQFDESEFEGSIYGISV